jgi:4-nitrophenyl phosphatase
MTSLDFGEIQGVVSDMDGVLWRGAEPLPGLAAFFGYLREAAIPFVLATNNSAKSEAEYVEKLAGLGVAGINAGAIVTSRRVLIDYMRARWPTGERVYAIGSDSLVAAIETAGFALSDEARIVAVGIDRRFTYEKLAIAARLVRRGAAFLGTNPDPSLPDGEELVPGAGSLLAAIAAASGVQPIVMGKPSQQMFDTALRTVGTAPAYTLMIGDRLETDMFGAKRAGMRTALVLSGVTTQGAVADGSVRPDYTFNGLAELVEAMRAGRRG